MKNKNKINIIGGGLAGCEAAFRYGGQVNFQIQLARRQDAVPLTRDYIQEWESKHMAATA